MIEPHPRATHNTPAACFLLAAFIKMQKFAQSDFHPARCLSRTSEGDLHPDKIAPPDDIATSINCRCKMRNQAQHIHFHLSPGRHDFMKK